MIAIQHGCPNWTRVLSLWIICLFVEELAQLEYNCVVIDVTLVFLFSFGLSGFKDRLACLLTCFKILYLVMLSLSIFIYSFQIRERDIFLFFNI